MSLEKTSTDVLRLSKVKENEKVLLFKSYYWSAVGIDVDPYYKTLETAVASLGAKATTIEIPAYLHDSREALSTEFPGILELMKQSDLLINAPLYSTAHNEALESGARSLMLAWPLPLLLRLFPRDVIKERALISAKLFSEAEEIRVTTDAGTDMRCNIKGRKGTGQYGRADLPGKWDNVCSQGAGSAPIEDSANGVLVIDGFDGIIPAPYAYMVTEPIKLTIKDGNITKIEGGAHAKLVEEWLASFHDEESYGLSHIGWGINEHASYTHAFLDKSPMDYESNYCGMLIAFGTNMFDTPYEYSGLGGKNYAPSHLDLGVRNIDFYLDDNLIVSKGNFVEPKLKALGPT